MDCDGRNGDGSDDEAEDESEEQGDKASALRICCCCPLDLVRELDEQEDADLCVFMWALRLFTLSKILTNQNEVDE